MRSLLVGILLIPLVAAASPSDFDNDGIPNLQDKCVKDPRNAQPNQDCDDDGDGYGNACDPDFDQNFTVNSVDFGAYFIPAFGGGAKSRGQDMDCNGTVNGNDFSRYFVPKFNKSPQPGPSKCNP